MLLEVELDPTRTHFLGRLPYAEYVKVLQVSAVHVYLTYPFVLSWSVLEAMTCRASVVGSNTQPVQEVVRNGENGRLVDFFDADDLAFVTLECLDDSPVREYRSQRALEQAGQFSRANGLHGYDRLVDFQGMRMPTGWASNAVDKITGIGFASDDWFGSGL